MYGLRASISGHSADVRVMIPCNYPMNGGFVTGGRDNDAKLWFPSGTGPGYDMMTRFRFDRGIALYGFSFAKTWLELKLKVELKLKLKLKLK